MLPAEVERKFIPHKDRKMKVKMDGRPMRLAEALAPHSEDHGHDPISRALDAQAKAIGAIAARMVELRQWTLAEASAACGQSGIEHVREPIGEMKP